MKISLKHLLAAVIFLTVIGAHAQPIVHTVSNNVTVAGTTFTFPQFAPLPGTTLTAVDLIIQSSTLQGSLTYVRTSGSRTFNDLEATLSIDPNSGFNGYNSSALLYSRTPSGSFTLNSTVTSRVINVTGTTQSLIGGSAVSFSIDPAQWGAFTGFSTISFDTFLLLGDNNTGSGAFSINSASLLSPTTITLQYSSVPEPGQVAASLLLLSGIGGYWWIKRRKAARRVTA